MFQLVGGVVMFHVSRRIEERGSQMRAAAVFLSRYKVQLKIFAVVLHECHCLSEI